MLSTLGCVSIVWINQTKQVTQTYYNSMERYWGIEMSPLGIIHYLNMLENNEMFEEVIFFYWISRCLALFSTINATLLICIKKMYKSTVFLDRHIHVLFLVDKKNTFRLQSLTFPKNWLFIPKKLAISFIIKGFRDPEKYRNTKNMCANYHLENL